jgi:N-methylhydantoinase A
LEGLGVQARAFAKRAGLPASINYLAEARYEGQAWEIDVPLPADRFAGDADVEAFRAAFDAMHEQIFTIRDPQSNVEIVGLRAAVRCRAREGADFRLQTGSPELERSRTRPVYFAGAGFVPTPVLRWDAVPADRDLLGPALVESPFTTVVVDPSARFRRSGHGALLIEA